RGARDLEGAICNPPEVGLHQNSLRPPRPRLLLAARTADDGGTETGIHNPVVAKGDVARREIRILAHVPVLTLQVDRKADLGVRPHVLENIVFYQHSFRDLELQEVLRAPDSLPRERLVD